MPDAERAFIAYEVRTGQRPPAKPQAFAVQPRGWLPVRTVTGGPARVTDWWAVATDGRRQVWTQTVDEDAADV